MKKKSINRPKKWLLYEKIQPARTRLLEVRSFSRLQTDSIFQQVKKSKLVYSGICRKPQSWDKKNMELMLF